ncbi:MAG: response regulator transcription factor [Actinomycetia bacterium]|nr:response regulator transcription factor [Actinomycetes bacterium]
MRLLVVEDEPRLAAGLRSGLEAEGFAVDVASDGVDGLWMAQENAYDALVIDIMLPGLSGDAICARLRADAIWTPILMLTARDSVPDQVGSLDGGADDYMTKPFSFAVLVARIRALMRRDVHERPPVLEAGDLRLDVAAKRAWRAGTEVRLTVREQALLEFLLRRHGEVVSKREILEHVWTSDFECDSNIVEVYIRHLRNKVDRPFGRDTIRTVRGAGYQLVADGD